MPSAELSPGEVIWVDPPAAVGREQAGRRPALVVAGAGYPATVTTLVLVVSLTSVDRGWPNHVRIAGTGLPFDSWAMTEQIRAISRERIVGRAGRTSEGALAAVRVWLADFLEL